MFVGLTGNSKRIFFETHRAVMLAFNPINDAYHCQVNHINHIKNDNKLENLEWVSQCENLAKKYEVVNLNKVKFVLKQYLDETTIKEISKKLRG